MRGGILALAVTAAATAGPVAQVPPGSVVRWPGDALESCARGQQSWSPLDGACYYPVDMLEEPGVLELVRTRGGARETVSIRVGSYPYPVQELTLPPSKVSLAAGATTRIAWEPERNGEQTQFTARVTAIVKWKKWRFTLTSELTIEDEG